MQKKVVQSIFGLCLSVCLLSACAMAPIETAPVEVTPVAPAPVVPAPMKCPAPKIKMHSLGVIGEVEPVYFLPMKQPIASRIDTGAAVSSVDAQNIQLFEREGVKWVAFDIINRKTGEKAHFEKKLLRQTRIKRQEESEDRYVVRMPIKMGKERINAQITLADRSKFQYQGLIGRNILTGRALVDTTLANTLY